MVPHGLLLLQKKNVQHERFRFQRKHPEPDRPDTTVGIAAKRPMSPTPEERTPLKALFVDARVIIVITRHFDRDACTLITSTNPSL